MSGILICINSSSNVNSLEIRSEKGVRIYKHNFHPGDKIQIGTQTSTMEFKDLKQLEGAINVVYEGMEVEA